MRKVAQVWNCQASAIMPNKDIFRVLIYLIQVWKSVIYSRKYFVKGHFRVILCMLQLV